MYMEIINFPTVALDFSENYFNTLSFKFKEVDYDFKVMCFAAKEETTILGAIPERLQIYCPNIFICNNPQVNKMYPAKGFDIAWIQDNYMERRIAGLPPVDDGDFGLATIFNKYKLALFY